jgi:hypothetical protein
MGFKDRGLTADTRLGKRILGREVASDRQTRLLAPLPRIVRDGEDGSLDGSQQVVGQ